MDRHVPLQNLKNKEIMMTKTLVLNNGVEIPKIGLGVWRARDDEAYQSVLTALQLGYRHIDTASIYENEEQVGQAIKDSGVPREDIFVTTKVWNDMQGYDTTLQAFEASLKRLQLDYVDLYLVHWPRPKKDMYIETYRALEALYEQGKVRAIGVSNFKIPHLQRLLDNTKIVPVLNQIECHPYFQQQDVKAFCKQYDIKIEAWAPIMRAGTIFEDTTIQQLAQKYDKTPAQIILRWHLQEETIAIPKSVTPSRIAENFDVFDFELSADDMKLMAQLDREDGRTNKDPDDVND